MTPSDWGDFHAWLPTDLPAVLAALAAPPQALMGTVLAWNLLAADRLEKAPRPSRHRLASILVPARNEEANLAVLLPLLENQTWPDMEILVLDDDSGDGTAAVALSHLPRVRMLRGKPLPKGWIGKSWACAQLAEEAKGDILLFCDADARPAPEAVARTLGLLEARKAGALACLPRQLLGTWAEGAVVPLVMHLPVLGFLPLPLVRRRPEAALSLGVGQWFAFTREAYLAIGGHASVRRSLAEDMALGRRIKEAGLGLAACLSVRDVSVRMYRGAGEVRAGFRKNLVVLTGTGRFRAALVLAAYLAIFVVPWALALWAAFSLALGAASGLAPMAALVPGLMLLASRLAVAAAYREPAWAWLASPIGSLSVLALAVQSWRGYHARSLTWKGRRLDSAPEEDGSGGGLAPVPTREVGKDGYGD